MMGRMRLFLLSLVLILCAAPAFAGIEGKAQPQCALKNAEFCGKWQDTKGRDVIIAGDRIIYKADNSTDTCTIMKEGQFEDGRPMSLLICNISSTSTTPGFQTSYLLVMQPQDKWDKEDGAYWVHMLTTGDPDSNNPCFSDDPAKSRSCDLLSFYEHNKMHGHFTFSGPH